MAEAQRELAHDWGENRFKESPSAPNVLLMDDDGHSEEIPARDLAERGLARIVGSIPLQRKPPIEESIPTLAVTEPGEPPMKDGSYFLG